MEGRDTSGEAGTPDASAAVLAGVDALAEALADVAASWGAPARLGEAEALVGGTAGPASVAVLGDSAGVLDAVTGMPELRDAIDPLPIRLRCAIVATGELDADDRYVLRRADGQQVDSDAAALSGKLEAAIQLGVVDVELSVTHPVLPPGVALVFPPRDDLHDSEAGTIALEEAWRADAVVVVLDSDSPPGPREVRPLALTTRRRRAALCAVDARDRPDGASQLVRCVAAELGRELPELGAGIPVVALEDGLGDLSEALRGWVAEPFALRHARSANAAMRDLAFGLGWPELEIGRAAELAADGSEAAPDARIRERGGSCEAAAADAAAAIRAAGRRAGEDLGLDLDRLAADARRRVEAAEGHGLKEALAALPGEQAQAIDEAWQTRVEELDRDAGRAARAALAALGASDPEPPVPSTRPRYGIASPPTEVPRGARPNPGRRLVRHAAALAVPLAIARGSRSPEVSTASLGGSLQREAFETERVDKTEAAQWLALYFKEARVAASRAIEERVSELVAALQARLRLRQAALQEAERAGLDGLQQPRRAELARERGAEASAFFERTDVLWARLDERAAALRAAVVDRESARRAQTAANRRTLEATPGWAGVDEQVREWALRTAPSTVAIDVGAACAWQGFRGRALAYATSTHLAIARRGLLGGLVLFQARLSEVALTSLPGVLGVAVRAPGKAPAVLTRWPSAEALEGFTEYVGGQSGYDRGSEDEGGLAQVGPEGDDSR